MYSSQHTNTCAYNNNHSFKCDSLESYVYMIHERCRDKIVMKKNKKKIEDDEFSVLKFNEYSLLLTNNYNLQQLKTIAKKYKLKVAGNKDDLVKRLYSFLKLSNTIIIIQKMARSYLLKKYIKCHGPAFYNRRKCNNEIDFLSMEPIEEIPYNQFFSFQDIDNFVYSFDILSFYNLIYKTEGNILNPYNRRKISSNIIQTFKTLLRLSKLLKIEFITELNDINEQITPSKSLEMRIITLFQTIDSLGNYSNASWFTSLSRTKLLTFARELIDIWNYRANLSPETRLSICPPLGDPFGMFFYNNLLHTTTIHEMKLKIVEVLEKLVNSGIDQSTKSLGAYYVLSALTLVNQEAANALPWLFDAVIY